MGSPWEESAAIEVLGGGRTPASKLQPLEGRLLSQGGIAVLEVGELVRALLVTRLRDP